MLLTVMRRKLLWRAEKHDGSLAPSRIPVLLGPSTLVSRPFRAVKWCRVNQPSVAHIGGRQGVNVKEFTRLHSVMELAAVGAALAMLSELYVAGTAATLSTSASSTPHNLDVGAGWLHFAAIAVVFGAAGAACREQVRKSGWAQATETGTATVATLLIAIGSLIAVAAHTGGSAASGLQAVGYGLWGLLLGVHGAAVSPKEHRQPRGRPQAGLWVVAGTGLIVAAVGRGLMGAASTTRVLVANPAIDAAGILIVAGTIAWAVRRQCLGQTQQARLVFAGLVMLAFSDVVAAVYEGVYVNAINPSLDGVRLTLLLGAVLGTAGFALLCTAAVIQTKATAALPPDLMPAGSGSTPARPPDMSIPSAYA